MNATVLTVSRTSLAAAGHRKFAAASKLPAMRMSLRLPRNSDRRFPSGLQRAFASMPQSGTELESAHLIFHRKQATEFIEFLEHIVSHYPTGKVHIALHNFSVHMARSVQA